MPPRRVKQAVLIVLVSVLAACFGQAQTPTGLPETEVTPEFLAMLQSKLRGPASTSQSEVLDQLVFGKGYVVRIEGKSRKAMILRMDGNGKHLVRLFDLSKADLNDPTLKGIVYFNGVLVRVEQGPDSALDIYVNYARLSSGAGHPYSVDAKAFVQRTQEIKRRNESILSKTESPSPASDAKSSESKKGRASSPPAKKEELNAPKQTVPAPPTTTRAPESQDKAETDEEVPRNRPVLKRRREQPETETASPSTDAKPSDSKQQSSDTASPPPPQKEESSAPKPTAPPPQTTTKVPESKDKAETGEEGPRNRPVLKRRREQPEGEGPAAGNAPSDMGTPPTTAPADDSAIQMRQDQDVVVYRRKKGSAVPNEPAPERPAPPLSRANPKPPTPVVSRSQPEDMSLIPEGTVTLGSSEAADQEKPLHRVAVRAFYIDKHEVTNAEYKKFCDATGHRIPSYWQNNSYPEGTERRPVVQVSWYDAMAYAKWAGKRLPTEVEWERAARGSHSFQYSYGNGYDSSKANTATGQTSAVGSYPPNDFGLYDMTGNANEWVSSLFKPYPYQATDGREDPAAEGARVLRGGSHSSGQENSRCLVRLGGDPSQGGASDGFRCARDAE